MRIEELLDARVRRSPDHWLVTTPGRRFSYRDVDQRSSRLVRGLIAAGLVAGDRIAVAAPNGIEYIDAMFAAAKANLVLVPVNHRCSAAELEQILEQSNAACVIVGGSGAAELIALAKLRSRLVLGIGDAAGDPAQRYETFLAGAPNNRVVVADKSDLDPWLLAFTSGTTRQPKGVVLSHRAKFLSAVTEALEWEITATDVALLNTPMFHVHGLVMALMMVAAGAAIVITEEFSPRAMVALIDAERITQLSMVPTMFRALLDVPGLTGRELAGVRGARSTGAPLSASLKAEILARFPGLPLHVMYGATEAGAITSLGPADLLRKDGSVGQALLGVTLEIRDAGGRTLPPGEAGEVFIASDVIFTGYVADRQLPAAIDYRRWITLGDVGAIDSEGFLFLQGRAADVIITGGENVAAQEVEDALADHPAVRAVAVLGIPDPYWGERIKGFVELNEAVPASADEILGHAATRLARHKVPKEIEIVERLPRNDFGKLDKRALRARIATSTS